MRRRPGRSPPGDKRRTIRSGRRAAHVFPGYTACYGPSHIRRLTLPNGAAGEGGASPGGAGSERRQSAGCRPPGEGMSGRKKGDRPTAGCRRTASSGCAHWRKMRRAGHRVLPNRRSPLRCDNCPPESALSDCPAERGCGTRAAACRLASPVATRRRNR